MPRLTSTDDLANLNRALDHLDNLTRQVTTLQKQIQQVHTSAKNDNTQAQQATANNLVFTWTGGTTTMSWTTGFLKVKGSENFPVIAGSRVLSPSTFYWAVWNPVHKVMAFVQDVNTVMNNLNNIIIAQVFTGTGGQTGTAGGGGSEAQSGISGGRYKNF